MASDSEIFILGGRGMLGSAFADYCDKSGRPYTVIARGDYASLRGRSCDIFVNANGNSRKPLASAQPLEDFEASVRSVRASLVDFRYRRYVHLSSCDVYPTCDSAETTREEQIPDPARQSPYGFHKYLAEQCVQHVAREWLILRFGGFVGPGLKKNAIYDILRGGPLYLDPASELQYLHTARAAEIAFRLLDGGVGNEVFNVCGKGVVRLSEVAALSPTAVTAKPGSPLVRYEISLEKLSRYVAPPETRPEVLAFVREQLGRTTQS
jgi:nucleoside-diphosphate-sugar epimerase